MPRQRPGHMDLLVLGLRLPVVDQPRLRHPVQKLTPWSVVWEEVTQRFAPATQALLRSLPVAKLPLLAHLSVATGQGFQSQTSAHPPNACTAPACPTPSSF